jgi:hypothetical protein
VRRVAEFRAKRVCRCFVTLKIAGSGRYVRDCGKPLLLLLLLETAELCGFAHQTFELLRETPIHTHTHSHGESSWHTHSTHSPSRKLRHGTKRLVAPQTLHESRIISLSLVHNKSGFDDVGIMTHCKLHGQSLVRYSSSIPTGSSATVSSS